VNRAKMQTYLTLCYVFQSTGEFSIRVLILEILNRSG